MADSKDLFKGKKITLLGLGLLGRGVGDTAFLAECGAEIIVTDKKSEAELAASVEQLKEYPNITFHLGEQSIADFQGRDLVLYAAGVPKDSPYIRAARDAGIPVVMSTALFAKHAMDMGAKIVGVTGTRGKSTVTQMIYRTLSEAYPDHVHLGGNIRGLSTLAILPKVQAGDICVLELDSWQLQGFGDMHMSPHIAIFTNLMPDHQNYYKSMDEYFADKALIFTSQSGSDVLICGASVADRIRASNPPLDPIVPEPLPKEWKLQIPGDHNRENASLAMAALEALGLDDVVIQKGLESFTAVEGRLQFVREVSGVKIYNDNNATTPEATIAALRALGEKKNVILIAGGSDKGLDLSHLVEEIQRTCKKVLLLDGAGTKRLLETGFSAEVFSSTALALEAAMKSAQEGGVILFSPAFASFGMFKNEYERNDQFLALVAAL